MSAYCDISACLAQQEVAYVPADTSNTFHLHQTVRKDVGKTANTD